MFALYHAYVTIYKMFAVEMCMTVTLTLRMDKGQL